MQIVLDTYGINMSVRNGCFLIVAGKEKRMVHPDRVNSILVTMPCRISSPAILLAATNEISLVICTRTGKPEARLWSPRFMNISTLRRKQYGFTRSDRGYQWMKDIIVSKLEIQQANIRFLADRKQGMAVESKGVLCEMDHLTTSLISVEANDIDCLKRIRFFEAATAKQYWQTVGKMMPVPFGFAQRIKQNPLDSFNPLLNYLYGMLRNQVETAILSFGLDPALGCMHRDGYKLPSLVFDLMEPFRPVTDRLLIEAVLAGKLNNTTEKDELGLSRITREGRKKVIGLFNEKLQKICLYKKSKTTLLNHILLETKQLTDKIKQYED